MWFPSGSAWVTNGRPLYFQEVANVSNFQILLNGACLPPHRSALPGLMTEAKVTLKAANSGMPHKVREGKVQGRPKGMGRIVKI